jgi:protein O-GlcNAc transferase
MTVNPNAIPSNVQLMLQEKFQSAMALHQQGQLVQAQALYNEVLSVQSQHADCLHLLGLIALQSKDYQRAANLIGKAIQSNPANAGYFVNHGIALKELGQLGAAITSYDRAIALAPNYAAAYYSRGNAQKALNQLDAAIASYDKALALQPNDVLAHTNRGMALEELQQLDAALASHDKAVALAPNFPEAHYNRGNVLKGLGQFDLAIAAYKAAIALRPDYAEAYVNMGVSEHEQQRWDAALAHCDKAIALKPDLATAHFNRGLALDALHQWDAALSSYGTAVTLKPDYAEAFCSRGRTFHELGKFDEALMNYDKAIALKAHYADAYYNRGITLIGQGKVDAAEKSYQRSLAINPRLDQAHHNLALSLQNRGEVARAMQSFRAALDCNPNRADSHTGLLYGLSSDATIDAQAVFEAHLRFGEQFEAPLRASWQPHNNTREPGRPLKVGIVSADLCRHAIATFIEPLLQELAQSKQCSLHAYYNNTIQDPVTARLKTYFAQWNAVAPLSDDALAEEIRADGIDILIDLSGHTALNRLLTFARKPAPIQITWMGFPGTTGLQAMDYYLTDRHFLPPGQFDHLFTEKLVYLPASAPFLPSADAPEVNALPALTNGYITFGSFNRRTKISRTVIALWAQVLRTVPESRMVIGAMEGNEGASLVASFAEEGIASDRLRVFAKSDMKTYLGLHHQVDICLDTFPYNGGTTTLHAAWMGVPTLTLSGASPVSRTGCAILGQLNLKAFQANSRQALVCLSEEWANRQAELAVVRADLRQRLRSAPLRQPHLIAAGLEQAFRNMWQRWCSELPSLSFDALTKTVTIAKP